MYITIAHICIEWFIIFFGPVFIIYFWTGLRSIQARLDDECVFTLV